MMLTINEVIAKLEQMTRDCRESSDPRGYFAALYLQMTKRVRDGISNGEFEDGRRMEKLDILFAQRYFVAWETWPNPACTLPWNLAFSVAKSDEVSVVQQLLCGINAHINLDLGIAASQTVSPAQLPQLKTDFYRINGVISDLMKEIQQKLGEISWPMRFLDEISGDSDSRVANFSIGLARDAAWQVALDLAAGAEETAYIHRLSKRVEMLGKGIAHPGFWPNLILKSVKWFEKGDVRSRIDLLLR